MSWKSLVGKHYRDVSFSLRLHEDLCTPFDTPLLPNPNLIVLLECTIRQRKTFSKYACFSVKKKIWGWIKANIGYGASEKDYYGF